MHNDNSNCSTFIPVNDAVPVFYYARHHREQSYKSWSHWPEGQSPERRTHFRWCFNLRLLPHWKWTLHKRIFCRCILTAHSSKYDCTCIGCTESPDSFEGTHAHLLSNHDCTCHSILSWPLNPHIDYQRRWWRCSYRLASSENPFDSFTNRAHISYDLFADQNIEGCFIPWLRLSEQMHHANPLVPLRDPGNLNLLLHCRRHR